MNENTVFDIVYLMIYADIKGKSWKLFVSGSSLFCFEQYAK